MRLRAGLLGHQKVREAAVLGDPPPAGTSTERHSHLRWVSRAWSLRQPTGNGTFTIAEASAADRSHGDVADRPVGHRARRLAGIRGRRPPSAGRRCERADGRKLTSVSL
ncbi:hypothetical protein SHO565_55380 [Streptomyces sp. HO565]